MLPPGQLARLQALHPTATVQPSAGGATVVVPDIALPDGWNRRATTVRWVVQVAYPAGQPDCFYAETDLRLTSGAMPSNSGMQSLDGAELLWFSWHLAAWDARRDDLVTYLRFIERRFARAD